MVPVWTPRVPSTRGCRSSPVICRSLFNSEPDLVAVVLKHDAPFRVPREVGNIFELALRMRSFPRVAREIDIDDLRAVEPVLQFFCARATMRLVLPGQRWSFFSAASGGTKS